MTPTTAPFHPLIQAWFKTVFGEATEIQRRAWPEIAAGRHVLLTAPTGGGKTLAAFLWAIDRLISGVWGGGTTRVLYISPLKALNNDIRYNLTLPLTGIAAEFAAAGLSAPEIRVLTRSGDTAESERRKMTRQPPEILITTPESLNLMLSSPVARRVFIGVKAVILDEIHAVFGTHRGVHLITAVDRLVPICGEFQRIGLSATIHPAQPVADFIGGYQWRVDQQSGFSESPDCYVNRPVCIIRDAHRKMTQIRILKPVDNGSEEAPPSVWPGVIRQVKAEIERHSSTLIFANSRRITEKVARLINADAAEPIAYAHHGSLSKELRLAVEQRLKQGRLKAIVATNSLELGIDIGDLDQVILIQSPRSVSSAVQRTGRSGHRVGETSRALLLPTHGKDYIEAAVIARSLVEMDLEPTASLDAPLDVLAQLILSMLSAESWRIDHLFAIIKTSYPYRNLSRRAFDLTLDMLQGRYAETRIRELNSRIMIDGVDGTVSAGKGVRLLLGLSGGVIPDRGYFELRVADTGAKIGELDEEFVWERKLGETFALGSRTWKIKEIRHNSVVVRPVDHAPDIIPFWKGETANRNFHLAEKIGLFLEDADLRLEQAEYRTFLQEQAFMDENAAEELIRFLQRQKTATGRPLPHRHHLLIEHCADACHPGDKKQVILHTGWGGRVNRPFALALSALWEIEYGFPLEAFSEDDCIMALLPHQFSGLELRRLMTPEKVLPAIHAGLEKTGLFGARFRECAGRALLLPKTAFNRRMPLWMNRLRAKKLLEAVSAFPDFPLRLETWRACFQDDFDLEHLQLVLNELACGRIRISETFTQFPSPLAETLVWRQTNHYMYLDDTPVAGKKTALSETLIKEIALSPRLRPEIAPEIRAALDRRLKRRIPGYLPDTPAALLNWIKERLLIPAPEWEQLVAAIAETVSLPPTDMAAALNLKLLSFRPPQAACSSVCALENWPYISSVLGIDEAQAHIEPVFAAQISPDQWRSGINRALGLIRGRATSEGAAAEADLSHERSVFLSRILSYYEFVSPQFLTRLLGFSASALSAVLDALARENRIIGEKYEGNDLICDVHNFEILLRMQRKAQRPDREPLEIARLPLFLAAYQGIAHGSTEPRNGLTQTLDQLFGFPAPVAAWEEDIFPARINGYDPTHLNALMQESALGWFGGGSKKIAFAFKDEVELFLDAPLSPKIQAELLAMLPDMRGKYAFFDIRQHSGLNSAEITEWLWRQAWLGNLSNDNFQIIRNGVESGFVGVNMAETGQRQRRSGFNRWQSTHPLRGDWYVIRPTAKEEDLLEETELIKDRIRQLFRRYGVLFRELLLKELPPLQYANVFRALRLMELSGEIFMGQFFSQLSGCQFLCREALEFLNQPLPEDAVFWLNALDPASLCGAGIEAFKRLPARIPSTYLVYHGSRLVLIARKNGKALDFQTPADDPDIHRYLSLFRHLLCRKFRPLKYITVETINRQPAMCSKYAPALIAAGFVKEYKGLEMRRVYEGETHFS